MSQKTGNAWVGGRVNRGDFQTKMSSCAVICSFIYVASRLCCRVRLHQLKHLQVEALHFQNVLARTQKLAVKLLARCCSQRTWSLTPYMSTQCCNTPRLIATPNILFRLRCCRMIFRNHKNSTLMLKCTKWTFQCIVCENRDDENQTNSLGQVSLSEIP